MNTSKFDLSNIQDKNYYLLLRDLLEYIRKQQYNVGEKMPQESVLAVQLNTNRSTLREMLRVLEVMGVIDSRRGSGNIYLGNLEVGFMNLMLISSMLSENKPYEFCSIRAAIESAAIETFVDKAVGSDIFRLEILYEDKMAKNVDKNDLNYLEAHIAFHDTLMKYYENEAAKQLIRSNLRLMRRDYEMSIDVDSSLSLQEKEKLRQQLVNNSHAMILQAVKERDKVKARKLIIDHCFMAGLHKTYI